MIPIKVQKTDSDYRRISMENEDGIFVIEFAPNLDLYWGFCPRTKKVPDINFIEFEISKNDKKLYDLFNKLYRAIRYSKPYQNSIYDFDNKEEKLPKYATSEAIGLYQDGVIRWASDDGILDEASVLEMYKSEKGFVLKLIKGTLDFGFPTLFVRFRNSGSSYYPFNVAFMNHYRAMLQEYKNVEE